MTARRRSGLGSSLKNCSPGTSASDWDSRKQIKHNRGLAPKNARKNRLLSLVRPNSAGKTTFIRCLVGWLLVPFAALQAANQPLMVSDPSATPFSLADPAGPRFTDEQKQAQRDAGSNLYPKVMVAFSQGLASIRIPPGDYRFGSEHWGRDGVQYPLEFTRLRRAAAHPFTIDATGATFWFELPDDQAPHAHFCLGFKDCSNLIFRGATLDRGTRGHVEGRITQLDFANNRVEIQLSPGLTVPTTFNGGLEQRVLPFKADGRFCAPLYALQNGGLHLKYRAITPSGTAGRYFVGMGDTGLLDTIRNPQWRQTYGELGTLQVGDGLSCIYTVSCAVELVHCDHLIMDGIKVFIPKASGGEWGGDGGHLWKNCYFGPRPGTSQWQGGEGFLFCATRHGTALDEVVMRHTGDDVANFHGYWGHIESLAGNRVTFLQSSEFDRTVLLDAAPGDRLVFRDRNTGQPIGDARFVRAKGNVVVTDRPVTIFTNTIVEWPDHECAGWQVCRCVFQDNYQRLLIQSGPGTISNCVFVRQGCGIEINSDFPYVEGGVAHDIKIMDNTFVDVNPQPRGAAVSMHTHTYDDGSPPFSDIVITGNTFIRPGAAAITLDSFNGGVIASNRFEHTAQPPIALKHCSGVREEDNRLSP